MNHGKHQMTNSHLLVHRFGYLRPASLEEAVHALVEQPDAKLLAGGTNLIVDMKLENASPANVIDITRLDSLSGIGSTESGTTIGTLTSIRSLAVSESLWRRHTCLAEAAAAFGSTQVAMMGTLGGNIANGSPASDTVPALVVEGAEATIVGPSGERTILVADLLQGPGRVALQQAEVLTEVRIPGSTANCGSAFLKLSRVKADLAKVSVAVRLVRDGDTIVGARIALGSVGPTVIRARKASAMLSDKAFSKDLVLNAARVAAEEITPIDDVRSTADYRRRAAVALVHDACVLAWRRAAEDVRPTHRGASTERTIPSNSGPLHVEADESVTISLTVNGHEMELEVAPNELLLNLLRERLELTGAKYGCGIGECAACTVWMNGAPILGCLVLAVAADGATIQTIEGEAIHGELSALQRAFINENAFQCGYCTPGMLMMTKKLLEEIADPTEDEIRDYLKGNHCRCTGYASIVRAVRRAAGEIE